MQRPPHRRLRPLSVAFGLLATSTATAGPLDGFYEVVSIEDPHGIRTAEQLQPEDCWSRELWVFQDGTLSRGHQERCRAGKDVDTCEVWVSVEVTFGQGLTIPYTAQAAGRSRRAQVTEETRNGDTRTTRTSSGRSCETRADSGRYQLTVEDADEGGKILVLDDRRRDVTWRLQAAQPDPPPFSEVSR